MISFSDLDELEKRLCDLICEYDSLIFHICPYIERKYVLEFGLAEYELYRLDLEIDKLERKIQLINEGNTSDYGEIADKEFEDYFSQIEVQVSEVNYFKNQDYDELSSDEFKRLNEAYRILISNLHFNIHSTQSFYERAWCIRTINAFKNSDLENLEALIETISGEELSPPSKVPGFEMIIDEFKNKIHDIKEEYPYNKLELVFDDIKKEKYHSMMSDLMSNRKETIKNLENKILELTS